MRRAPTLGTRLVIFSILFTVVVVATAFFTLSLEIRRHSRSMLVESLARNQRMILHLQQESLEQLQRTANVMTENPTLRAAMDTFRSEVAPDAQVRPELLATIRVEADKIANGLGHDLLIVTDQEGRVLAASGRYGSWPKLGEDLSTRSIVRKALVDDEGASTRNFGVITFHGSWFQASSAPIFLQGFIIGTLTLADPVDQRFVSRMAEAFDGEIVVTIADRIVGSTFRTGASSGPDAAALARAASGSPAAGPLLPIGGEDYVMAPLRLGTDEAGRPVTLYLLHSLTRTLTVLNRWLGWTLLLHGAFAILLTALAAWTLSRTVFRPLDRFVRFMSSVVETGNHAHRFDDSGASIEVRALNETYNRLMDSLVEHERRLRQSAQEEMTRVERLKESEKLAALGRMLSGAAHEINNPLTGVVGNVQMLLTEPGLSEGARLRLERVHHEGARIAALVRNLLRMAHRDDGPRAVLDVNRIVKDTIALRQHDFSSAGMRLEVDLSSERVRVFGNELELQQVFLNIINNAYDALADIEGDQVLRVRTAAEGDRVEVSIHDSGPGMKDPDKVFDHFYTTKEIGKGTGLGLSITHAIVQNHKGHISARNHPSGGAQFLIDLPSVMAGEAGGADGANGAGEAEERAEAAPAPLDISPLREIHASVLVVDDEPTVLDLEVSLLQSCGASVVGVGSGAEAIAVLSRRDFDLIVTDLKMPGGVSGEDLYRWAQEHRPSSAVRFVFVTGDTVGDHTQDFLKQTNSRYVLKPFSIDEYLKTLEEALRENPIPV